MAGRQEFNKSLNEIDSSITGVIQNLTKLINTSDQYVDQLKESSAALDKNNEALKKSEDNKQKLTKEEKEMQRAAAALDKQRQRGLQTLAKEEAEQRKFNEIMKRGVQTKEEARFVNKRLNAEVEKLNVTTTAGRKKAQEYNQTIDKNNKFIKQNSSAHARTKMSIGEYAKGVQSALLTVTAYAAAIYGVVRGFIELSRMTLEASKQNSQIASSFGISRDQADGMRAQVVSLARTMDDDYKNVLKATTVLQKEFGLTAQESLELVEEGFRKGANVNGEFLEQLKEYPAQLRSVGFTARESIAIIAETENQGIYSDKGIDAIKEAGLRLRENTKAVEDALRPLDAQVQAQIKTEIAAGNTFEAIKLISGELGNTEHTANEVQTIIADVFGGAGEDAGLRYLQNLKDINLNLDEIDNSLSEAEISQRELNLAVEQLKTAYLSGEGAISGFFTNLRGAVTGLINQLIKLREGGGAIAATFQALFSTIAINFKIAGQLIETFIIRPLKLVGQVSKAVFERDFGAIPGIIKQGLKEGKNDIVNFGLDVADTAIKVRDAFKGTGETISSESKVAGFATKENIGGALDEVNKKQEDFWKKYRENIQKSQESLDKFYDSQKRISSLSDLEGQNEKATDDIFKEQAEEEISLRDEINASIDENLEKEREANEEKIELYEQEKQKRQEIKDLGVNLTNELFELGKAQREAELADIQAKVDAGIITEEEGARKEKQIMREQARAEKTQAIFNAIVNVAEAVTKFGVITPQAILAGITGAVQIATIASQPIPKFKHGVKDKKDSGLSEIAEEGFELFRIPGKGWYKSPDTPTQLWLPEGSDVIPHAESKMIYEGGMTPETYDELIKSNKAIKNSIDNMAVHNSQWDVNGMRYFVEKNGVRKEYIDKYII